MRKVIYTASLEGLTHTFAGANESASVTTTADETLELVQVSESAVNDDAHLPNNVAFNIRKVRLFPSGADDLRKPQGKFAARLKLAFVGSDGNKKAMNTLTLSNWNQWESKTIQSPVPTGDTLGLVLESGSVANIADYNVQDAYIGKDVVPMLELEVEFADSIWKDIYPRS